MELWLSWDSGDDLKIGTGIIYATKNIVMEITEANLFGNVQNMTIGTMYSPSEFSIERKTSRCHEISSHVKYHIFHILHCQSIPQRK